MKLKIKTHLYNTQSEFKALWRKTCSTPAICLYIQNKYKNTTFNKRKDYIDIYFNMFYIFCFRLRLTFNHSLFCFSSNFSFDFKSSEVFFLLCPLQEHCFWVNYRGQYLREAKRNYCLHENITFVQKAV